jgi:hypothetical protein
MAVKVLKEDALPTRKKGGAAMSLPEFKEVMDNLEGLDSGLGLEVEISADSVKQLKSKNPLGKFAGALRHTFKMNGLPFTAYPNVNGTVTVAHEKAKSH